MKCPQCGFLIPRGKRGRPVKIDGKKLKALAEEGLSLRKIAALLGVTHGAIRAAMLRMKGK